jgi:hypothetical protein
MEYLKIAQDLEMYGVNYFAIRVCGCCPESPASEQIPPGPDGQWLLLYPRVVESFTVQ